MNESLPCWVGFDTSNYTTSAAVAVRDPDTPGALKIAANLKAPLPVAPGGRGLRQSEAVFAHVKNLPGLIASLREMLTAGGYTVAGAGVSSKPRDAEDSYMPCFLVGVAAAEAFAAGAGCPLYTFSHQSGHITAALYSSGALYRDRAAGRPLTGDYLAFHVSGGTTEAVAAHPRRGGFDVELLGRGADLHAGQVIDRTGVMMGLDFPCGPALERLAVKNQKKLPPVKLCVRDGVCNLSGVENQAAKLWRDTQDGPLVASYVLTFIGRTLRLMTDQIQEKLAARGSVLPVVYAGGVMSNRFIRPIFSEGTRWEVLFSEPAFSADNAAGIALLCAEADISAHESTN
ncbi:MAG: peptidase M22 [Clostridia bacterium]|nr:peptidase M22 [Clostridia bacterium]